MKPGRQDRRRRRSEIVGGMAARTGVGRHSANRSLRVDVDRIVIEGLPRLDGEALGRSLERELVDQLGTQGPDMGESRTIDRIDAGKISGSPVGSTDGLAARLARSISERIDQ